MSRCLEILTRKMVVILWGHDPTSLLLRLSATHTPWRNISFLFVPIKCIYIYVVNNLCFVIKIRPKIKFRNKSRKGTIYIYNKGLFCVLQGFVCLVIWSVNLKLNVLFCYFVNLTFGHNSYLKWKTDLQKNKCQLYC